MLTEARQRIGLEVVDGEVLPVMALEGGARIRGRWMAVVRRNDGRVEEFPWRNLITNEALNHILSVVLAAGTQDTTWFLGLKGTGSPAAGDTLASHAGWTELTAYDETNRVAWVPGSVAGQSVDNTASPAVFTIDDDGVEVHGAFLAGVNSGTSGVLFAVGDFPTEKLMDSGETLSVFATFTQQNAA